jgi:dipeptidyl-peptidase-4
VLVERADNSSLQKWYISDPSSPHKQPTVHRYPAAGTANPLVSYSVVLIAADTPAHVPVMWDAAAFEYVVTASFSAKGPLLTVMNRSQTKQQVTRPRRPALLLAS